MKKKTLFATLVLSLLTFLTYILVVAAVDYFISGSGSYYVDDVVLETELNGTYFVEDAGESNLFGWSVASGDVNNDGYADVVVGAYGDDSGPVGQVFVFFGTANGISSMESIFANITFNGTGINDRFGYSVGSGDVNNDSYADVMVGAYNADPLTGSDDAGQAYVFFGADYTTVINEDASTYANITLNGTTADDYFGISVGSGDVNNDSYADVIVGARRADPSGAANAGQAFVFFGADYTSAVNQNALLYANITLNGTTADDNFGISVGSGDINNDSYADVIVGAYGVISPLGVDQAGQAFVFFGADYTSAVNQNASLYANITLNGTAEGEWFGWSVASGDVNNDSYDDVIVGVWPVDQAFVFFGADYTSAINEEAASYANITLNGTVASDRFGYSVGSGDVNNDSYADVMVGAYNADPLTGSDDAGQAYVFFGADYTSTINEIAGPYANITLNGTTISSNYGGWFGISVASGDIRNDSYVDIIVGAARDDDRSPHAGYVHIYGYDDTTPAVTLDVPADNGYDTEGDANFSFTTVENHPEYCTLYFRSNVTNWAANDSTSYSSNTQANIFVNLTDAVYTWNVECNDTGNNPAFASANRTLTVDTTSPVTPILTAPTDTSINPRGSISYTCESSDVTAGISKWTWTLTKPQNGGTVTKTGGEVTSNSQSFSGDDDNLAGTYTVSCEAEDKAGHKSSSSATFTVYFSHVTGEGAGAGPSGAADIDFTTEEEITITEKQGTISTFTLDGITVHTIKIKTVDEAAGTVTIVIESDPITITLTIGETEEVDVDGDGINDISVTLNSIKNSVADITTKRLTPLPAKEKPTEEIQPTEAPEEEVTPPEAASKAWLWILIIVILAVIGVGYWFIQKKKKQF